MNIDHLREAFSPWIDVVIRDFSKNFLFDYGIDTLAFLHEKIDTEIESVYSARLKDKNCIISKSEALFTALTYLYNHFCWKMSHQKESPNVKKSCVKLLSQLIKTGLILSKGAPKSEWINRILTAIRLFTGVPGLIYEAVLLVSCLKPKYHRAYIIILKHVLINEDQECITDPLVYMEVILLFRRLKGLLKRKYSRACTITLATRIKPPCNLISWLMSLDVEGVNGLKYKTLAKQLMRNKVPETLLKKVRDIALSCYAFKTDVKREKYEEASNEPSDLFVIDVSSDEPPDLFVIDVSSVNDGHSVYQNQKLPQNNLSSDKYEPSKVCISSESNPKTVSLASSKKKKKKKKQSVLSQTENECMKSETVAAHETLAPRSYINKYRNLVTERDHVESATGSEDYYMGSLSDSSVNSWSLKDTLSKSTKKKQESKISPDDKTYSKEQKIEIIEICNDNEPSVDLTDANKIPKTKKRKPPEDLHSTNIASNSKKKMIKVDENEKFHPSSVDQSNSNNRIKLSKEVSFSELPAASNINSQLQFLRNSKPSKNLICKMPSKQNANKTVRLTENIKELTTVGLDQHVVPVSSAESIANSCTSVNMEQNTNVPSSLHVHEKGITFIFDSPKKSSLTAETSEAKILLESQSQSMEVDEEAAVKDALSSENENSSVFSKEFKIVSENVQNDDFVCTDSDNNLLFTKYCSKETNVSKIDVENSSNLESTQSSSDCANPNETPVQYSIDYNLKLDVSISNSNSSKRASENNYNAFVRHNVKGRQLDILAPDDTSINTNTNCSQNESLKSSENLIDLGEESNECIATDENAKLQSKYSEISNVQLLKNDPEVKICEENLSSDTTPTCSEFSVLSGSDVPATSNYVASEKYQHKRKLSGISNSDNAFLPVNYDSIKKESDKNSEKLIHLKKECVPNISPAENIQLQIKYIEISDKQNIAISKDLTSNKISEVSFSSETSSKCSETQHLVANSSQEISEDISSFEKQQHKKLSSISGIKDISSRRPESMEIDLLKASQKSDEVENSVKQVHLDEKSVEGKLLDENIDLKSSQESSSLCNTSSENADQNKFSSETSSKCFETQHLVANSSQEISEDISGFEKQQHKKLSSISDIKDISRRRPSESMEIDLLKVSQKLDEVENSVKQVHLDEKFVEGKLSDENIDLKSQESSSPCNASSENADQSKLSEEISLLSPKSSGTPHLNAATNKENSKNVSCSYEKKNMKRKLSDISDSNETPVHENYDLVGNYSFKDSDKVTQTGVILVRNESGMEDVESKSTVSNICNSTFKNADDDTEPEKLSLSPECTVKCSSSVINANIALETIERVHVVEMHQQEKLDVSDSNVKSVGESYNADMSESSNNNQCEWQETEIKIKTNALTNNQNIAEESLENSYLVKCSDNLDNFETEDLESCSISVQSAEEQNTNKPLLPGYTSITPENINTEVKRPINHVPEITSDEINKDNSTLDDTNKVPDINNEIAVKNACPEEQSQSSKFIFSSSDEVKFSGNNSDIDSSSFVTDSESKFSAKYGSSESIDILHNSDDGDYCKEIIDAKDNNIQNTCKEALQKTPKNRTQTLKQVELALDEECSKISNESSVSKEISKNSHENFPYTCKSENYLSFSDISLSTKQMSIINSCSESSNKLKIFSFAASTEIFSSYRNDLLSEEDKTSVLSCGPELKDCGSCKSQELSDDEKSKLSSDGSEGECYSDHSNSEVESNQMIDKVEIAPVENSSAEVSFKTVYDIKTEVSSKGEISENANESSCNEKNSATIDTDLQSKNECIEDHTLNGASNQVLESMPRHSLRLRNKSTIENKTQCNSSENVSHKERDFPNREIDDDDDDDSKQAIVKDNSISDNEKDISSINSDKVPPSPESIISKTPSAKQKSKSKEDTKVCSSSSRRFSLRQKCKKRDNSSKLGIDLSQLHLGSPSRRKPTKDNSIIAKLLPLESDPSEKIDDESDLTLSTKRETRSSAAKSLKEETILNTPSYNLRTRKSIIAPGKLKI